MNVRNSVLESLLLFPSFPAYFWNTAIRDSMHRSVSVGLDIFALEKKKCRNQIGTRYKRLDTGTRQSVSSCFGSKWFTRKVIFQGVQDGCKKSQKVLDVEKQPGTIDFTVKLLRKEKETNVVTPSLGHHPLCRPWLLSFHFEVPLIPIGMANGTSHFRTEL